MKLKFTKQFHFSANCSFIWCSIMISGLIAVYVTPTFFAISDDVRVEWIITDRCIWCIRWTSPAMYCWYWKEIEKYNGSPESTLPHLPLLREEIMKNAAIASENSARVYIFEATLVLSQGDLIPSITREQVLIGK